MKLLVTGGAGFIGSHYVRTLSAGGYPGFEGAEITVLDRLTYAGNLANLPSDEPHLHIVTGDVCDNDLLAELVPGHDIVVHFAAESHVDRSISAALPFVRSNVLGTQALLENCVAGHVQCMLYISTDEVYGSVDEGACDEGFTLAPSSPYAASKAAGEVMAVAYHRTYGLDVRITRGSNTYGPFQYPEKIVPLFTANLLNGTSVPLYGDGGNIREWLHVADHCRAIQLVLEKGQPGEIYNIGGGTALTNRELTAKLIGLCGASSRQISHVPDRKGHDRRYAVDWSKIRTRLGYRPLVDFEEGLRSTVRWYRENRWWWEAAKRPDATTASGGASRK